VPEVRYATSGNPIEIPAEVLTVGQLYHFLIALTDELDGGYGVVIHEFLQTEKPINYSTSLTDLAGLGLPSLSFHLQEIWAPVAHPQVEIPTDEPFPAFDTLPAQWQNWLLCVFYGRGSIILKTRPPLFQDPFRVAHEIIGTTGQRVQDGYETIYFNDQNNSFPRKDGDVIISVPTSFDTKIHPYRGYYILLYTGGEFFVLEREFIYTDRVGENPVKKTSGVFLPMFGTYDQVPSPSRLEFSGEHCLLIC
jgi:hypothetical protein